MSEEVKTEDANMNQTPPETTPETPQGAKPEAQPPAQPTSSEEGFEINFDEDPELALLAKLSPEERERYLRFRYQGGQPSPQTEEAPKQEDRVQTLQKEIKEIERKMQEAQAAGEAEKAAELFQTYLAKRDELTVEKVRSELFPEVQYTRALVTEVPRAVTVGKQFVLASNPEAKEYEAILERNLSELLSRDPSIAADKDKLRVVAEMADALALKQWYREGRKKRSVQPAAAAASAAGTAARDDKELEKKAKEAGFDSVDDYKHYLETGEYRI